MNEHKQPQKIINRIQRIWPHFKGGQKMLWLSMTATVIAAFSEPLIPALLKPLLDQGFQAERFNLWFIPIILIFLFGVRGLAVYIGQYGLTIFTNNGLLNLRLEMFEKLLYSELQLFKNQSSSELTNTLVYEVLNGATMLGGATIGLIKDIFTLVALVGFLCYLDWKLTMIVLIMFPAVALVMKILSKRLFRLTKESQKATDKLAYVVEENTLAHQDIRLQGGQSDQLNRFQKLSQELKRLSIKSTMSSSAMTPITQLLAAITLSAVISIALIQSETAGQSVGSFVSFITAMLMLLAPIKHLSEIANPITRGLAALERGIDLIEKTATESCGSYVKERALGQISYQNVSFLYQGSELPAVRNFTFEINPGQKIALVGTSGSGKSTLINLLPRFINSTIGSIQLDGTELQEWDIKCLRNQIAIVSQHVVMLNGSIADNISLGKVSDEQKIMESLQNADMKSFIERLPEGIHTQVGHNAMQLSGGQRQRLSIARAFYKDSPILILDEATSALDSESENAIRDSIARLMADRTTLVIAHRLTTIQNSDLIIVMDKGDMVETGTHTSLLENNGLYAKLYTIGFNK